MMNIRSIFGNLADLLAQLKDLLRGEDGSGSYEAELLKKKGQLVPVPVKNNKEFFGR